MRTSPGQPGNWVLAAPPERIRTLRPLINAHEREHPVTIVELPGGTLPEATFWRMALVGADGLLIVGDRRRSPRTVLPGPFLADAAGRLVPAGWLPNTSEEVLTRFARAAARVLRRTKAHPRTLALLGQRQDRYVHLAERMMVNLRQQNPSPISIYRWTADRITRDDLARALRCGLGAAVYFGHGRPSGWAGYHGLRAHHLAGQRGEPLSALISVTCWTASRWGVGLSFSELAVLEGVAMAAFGAVAPTAHVQNTRWMLGLAKALREGHVQLGQVLLRAAPRNEYERSPYRILGDPLAPLIGMPNATERADRVWAPAPDDLVA